MLDDEQQNLIEPFSLSVRQTMLAEHCGHTTVYERLARGEYEAVKDGNRTRILVASIQRRRANLPRAKFKPLPKRTNHRRRRSK
jgi:hypothetical protein